MGTSTYLIALGGNRLTNAGAPKATLASFVSSGLPNVRAASRIHISRPVGPGTRSYANAVALIESDLTPPELLAHLKTIERAHGRRAGQRWGNRPLDLDIIAWSGGIWSSPGLTIPHPAFRTRRFVLAPMCEIAREIAPAWRDPVTRLTARHLLARLDRRAPRP